MGIKILFDDNYIREFIKETKYDEIIKKAIINHNKLTIEEGLDSRTLIHAKIIRDADKLDNFRVKKEEKIEEIFPKIVKRKEELENSNISNKVYKSILKEECVDIHDRKTKLDYWVCVIGFIFDINFKETLEIIKEKDYLNSIIDRINYKKESTIKKMNKIKEVINNYINRKIKS